MTATRTPAWLDADLTQREAAVGRIATSVLELEQHPGLVLLTAGGLTGRTARRWADIAPIRDALWHGVALHRATVEEARAVRDRRVRPGERELAELHRLLVEPSLEIARTAVALGHRGLLGERERVEHIALPSLQDRLEVAFAQVRDLAVECAAARDAGLAALVPAAERLGAARELVRTLRLPADDPDAVAVAGLTTRLAAAEGVLAGDPLGRVPVVAVEVDAVAGRLEAQAALRGRWDAELAALDGALAALDADRAAAEEVRLRAADRIAGPVPETPDGPADLRERRAALPGLPWRDRPDAVAGLRRACGVAATDIVRARELAQGLLDRRDELRGRFGAYRARSARLGVAERPAVLDLDARIEQLLWSKPCDLAAATRALADYRREATP